MRRVGPDASVEADAAARDLPLAASPALALVAAALFLGGGPRDGRCPWLGRAAVVLGRLLLEQGPPGGPRRSPPARLARRLVRGLDRVVDRARTAAGAMRTGPSSTSLFALLGALLGAEPRGFFTGLFAPRCRLRLVARRQGDPLAATSYGRIARSRGPVGYWNSLALLGDVALPLGLCLATRTRQRRDAARLRLDRRDRPHLLPRRIARRCGRGRALDASLRSLDRGALDAVRGRLARRRCARASRFSLSGLTSDGQPHADPRPRRGSSSACWSCSTPPIAAAFARFATARGALERRHASGGGRRCGHRLSSAPSRRWRCARAMLAFRSRAPRQPS